MSEIRRPLYDIVLKRADGKMIKFINHNGKEQEAANCKIGAIWPGRGNYANEPGSISWEPRTIAVFKEAFDNPTKYYLNLFRNRANQRQESAADFGGDEAGDLF